MNEKDKRYIVVSIGDYYSPDLEGKGAPKVVYDSESVEDCFEWIEDKENNTYYLSHNEAGRPIYYVLEDYHLSVDDRYGYEDGSCYDWEDIDCNKLNGEACGECQACISAMIEQDIALVKHNQVNIVRS